MEGSLAEMLSGYSGTGIRPRVRPDSDWRMPERYLNGMAGVCDWLRTSEPRRDVRGRVMRRGNRMGRNKDIDREETRGEAESDSRVDSANGKATALVRTTTRIGVNPDHDDITY